MLDFICHTYWSRHQQLLIYTSIQELYSSGKHVMDPSQLRDPNMAFFWSSISTCLFFITNVVLRFFTPQTACKDIHQRWKWRNTANSLLHSSITGMWSCLCIWQAPEFSQDLISMYTNSAHAALSVSAGYFVYDLIDMMIGHRKRSSFELMIHHVLVIICFGLAIFTRHFLGFCIIGLLVEVNSVFLHARQLMHIQNVNRESTLYRINRLLNVGTFIFFRILTLGLLSIWIFQYRDKLTSTARIIGAVSLPIILTMNVVLFLRILNTDYLKKASCNTKLTHLLLNENEDWKSSENKSL